MNFEKLPLRAMPAPAAKVERVSVALKVTGGTLVLSVALNPLVDPPIPVSSPSRCHCPWQFSPVIMSDPQWTG